MSAILIRVGQAALTLAGAAALVWALQILAPGDPARQVLIARGIESPSVAQVTAARAELRLEDPAYARLGHWFVGVVQGDLGTSWSTGRPVSVEIAERLPATVRLTSVALALALAFAMPLALLAVARRGRTADLAARFLMFGGAAVPTFVLGTVLLDVVAVRLGVGAILADGSWSAVLLPALPIAVATAATWARVLRTVMVERSGSRFVEVAYARGSSRLRLLVVHLLPGAVPALLTAVGISVGGLLAGAAVVETIFTWPGIGRFLVAAIAARDVPVVQACVLFGVLAYVLASTLADAVAALIEPGAADGRR
ncbi:ABC transporter permease subunit [Actinopolymorpha pittospori]|uniref:ABC-type dipeptide/oligopeptide/nickel transport system permease component n=1 Tax=Actinopolymorpha pittospori TaxID=648752 RepID=A0A927R6R9_9ACTN|nr:ABC-type dipeptide/oligopeptide/nickel transport system permease component [Actinopolymorpha pittospori]